MIKGGGLIMKTCCIVLATALTLVALLGAAYASQTQTAESWDLSWFTWDGGGGESAGGTYVLNGTIGQPDAGTMTGGTYSLEGGFWPGVSQLAPPVPKYQIWFMY